MAHCSTPGQDGRAALQPDTSRCWELGLAQRGHQYLPCQNAIVIGRAWPPWSNKVHTHTKGLYSTRAALWAMSPILDKGACKGQGHRGSNKRDDSAHRRGAAPYLDERRRQKKHTRRKTRIASLKMVKGNIKFRKSRVSQSAVKGGTTTGFPLFRQGFATLLTTRAKSNTRSNGRNGTSSPGAALITAPFTQEGWPTHAFETAGKTKAGHGPLRPATSFLPPLLAPRAVEI